MELKTGDKVVVGLIWNGGYIFKERGEVAAIINNRKNKPMELMVNGKWYKPDDLCHEEEWNKAINILENRK